MSTNSQAQDDPIAPTTFTAHALSAMQMAEKYIQSGDKAEFAQQVLMREVAESAMTDDEKELCRAIANTGILKDIFGLVVDATKGKLDINKIEKRTRKCCVRWFGVCGKGERDENGNGKDEEHEMEEPSDTPIPIEPTSDDADSTEEVFFVNEEAVKRDAAGSPSASSLV